MQKRGVSHIEVILSFVLFITAVAFIIAVFNPVSSGTDNSGQLSQAITILQKNVSVKLVEIALKLNISTNNITFLVQNFNFEDVNASAVDYLGNRLKTYNMNSLDVCIESNSVGPIPSFVYIRASRDILLNTSNSDACSTINETYYEISSINERQVVSELKLIDINKTYYSGYSDFKNNLGLNSIQNFNFEVDFPDGYVVEGNRTITPHSEVKSVTKQIEIVRKNGEIQFANLIVKIW